MAACILSIVRSSIFELGRERPLTFLATKRPLLSVKRPSMLVNFLKILGYSLNVPSSPKRTF